MKRTRIQTADCSTTTVKALAKIAKKNGRKMSKEALIAVESYIVAAQSKP